MALIDCPDCARQVSDRADACPECGHPVSEMRFAPPPLPPTPPTPPPLSSKSPQGPRRRSGRLQASARPPDPEPPASEPEPPEPDIDMMPIGDEQAFHPGSWRDVIEPVSTPDQVQPLPQVLTDEEQARIDSNRGCLGVAGVLAFVAVVFSVVGDDPDLVSGLIAAGFIMVVAVWLLPD